MTLQASFADESGFDVVLEQAPSGPFYFAYADMGEAFDAASHTKFEADIFEFVIEHIEGDFPTLQITFRNPHIGLLAPGRKRWAWLSWSNGSEVIPLFYGRLVGIPDQIQDELVVVSFIARPVDYVAQKEYLAEELRQYGVWDPIWFSTASQSEPDRVLESNPVLWHIDRITHDVTVSNIASGEDGDLLFDGDSVFYDSVHVTYGTSPLRRVDVVANVSWDQIGSGVFNIGGVIESNTGEGLVNAWPREGMSLGGGWKVISSNVNVLFGPIPDNVIGEFNYSAHAVIGGDINFERNWLDAGYGGFSAVLGTFGDPAQGVGWSFRFVVPNWRFTYSMTVGYETTRQKAESLSFSLSADVQDVLTEPDDEGAILIEMSSAEVVSQGAIPTTNRGYFNTARGKQSIEYLIAIARCNLIARARMVTVAFETPFEIGVSSALSLRKNGIILDDRLPGGEAGGKITKYSLSMRDGQKSCGIEIGCMIGRSGTLDLTEGTPDYCDDDYVGDDYQFYVDSYVVPGVGDVAYTDIEGAPVNDDGLTLVGPNRSPLLLFAGVINNSTAQGEDTLGQFQISVDDKGQLTAVNTSYARFQMQLRDVTGGPFVTEYAIGMTELKIPKTIDLEAEAAS